ncbi:hypothetical protein [Streptomyces sp. BA2]|uniref:hypothetical protein n=1 Tax=Streptomyces sp. BA2 TaxID=436595 RepID=UPI001F3FF284|nr:hypothetical protein [Streptomyces sp. BA2]
MTLTLNPPTRRDTTRREGATGGEVLWLQPYPDRLLDELPAGDADEPEAVAVAVAQETIELAYLVADQHLAPSPRAVLILRDVLGWPAKDVAELLREHLPAERQDWTGGEQDAGTRELVRRYTEAGVATDADRLATLLRDDVRRRLLPVAESGGRVPAAADRRPARHRRGDHRDRHVPRRPVPAARAAGAPAGGRHGVVPVGTLALRGSARVAVVAVVAVIAVIAVIAAE